MNQQDSSRQQRLRVRFAIAFVLLGVGILAWLLFPGRLPAPLWLLVVLGVIGIYVEWSAVEVNDQLMISSSALVQMTSAVIFASSEPVVAVALIAAVSPIQPADVSERRWFQPSVNFGQLVASATTAALVFAAIAPDMAPTTETVPRFVLAAVTASVVHGVVNYILVQFIFTSVYGKQQVRQLRVWIKEDDHFGRSHATELFGIRVNDHLRPESFHPADGADQLFYVLDRFSPVR